MKKTRKLISLLMALAMIFALAIPAFAQTVDYNGTDAADGEITISNAVDGETYKVYQMLVLTYNETTQSYSYKATDNWQQFFISQSGYSVDNQGYVTSTLTDESSEVAAVAAAALKYAEEKGLEATASGSADADGITFENLPLGYYLVDTSLGTLCSIDTTDKTVEIKEKNSSEPKFEKEVKTNEDDEYGDSNTASVGDTVYYQITVDDIENKSNVTVSDTLSNGLTLNVASIKITYDGQEVLEDNTTYSLNTDISNGFVISFVDSYLAGKTGEIIITYDATVNENAVIGTDGNTNKAILDYGNGSNVKSDYTTTKVFKFGLKKIDSKQNLLSGAQFTLTAANESEAIYFVYDEQTSTYCVATGAEMEEASQTISAGDVTISGLAAGTYTLTETEAPDGYNLLKGAVTVEITNEGTVSVTMTQGDAGSTNNNTVVIENATGSELPSTGGMGTTLFYIFGGALVLCAVVLLVTRRRMDNEQ